MVETSALVAILLEEPGWLAFAERIDSEPSFTTSVAAFEATLSLAKHTNLSATRAYAAVDALTTKLRIEVRPVTAPMIALAAEARERFGAGRHGLNMGDCLSYGAAKFFKTAMLYKGDDFGRTDVNEGFADL